MSMIARSLSKINEMINNVFEAKSFRSSSNTINSLTEGAVVLNGSSGSIVLDNNGGKRITWNDGAGNFVLRENNRFIGGQEVYVGDNGATSLYINGDGGEGECRIQIADKGNDGAPVVWSNTVIINKTGVTINGNKVWHEGNDGNGSGLNADFLKGYGINTFMNNLGTAVSTQSTSGYIQAGRGNGGVALTHNDAYGNANVTFNHQAGVPEQDGNAARITVNTDGTLNSSMLFQVGSGVSKDTAVGLTSVLNLTGTEALLFGHKVWHSGDGAASFAQNGYQKLPSGLIIQWGHVTIDGTGQDFTLPITYPNIHIIAIAQGVGDVTNGSIVNANPTSASTITIGNVGNATEAVEYISIGY